MHTLRFPKFWHEICERLQASTKPVDADATTELRGRAFCSYDAVYRQSNWLFWQEPGSAKVWCLAVLVGLFDYTECLFCPCIRGNRAA
eukprot:scaffold149132_cov21-Tisochrysis_lutea.AAC.1